jgi:TIR domain-containing protein
MSAFRSTFISHAHADNAECDRFVVALRSQGINIWYDRDNAQAGSVLGVEIQRELVQRSAFLLLLTQQALDSFWVPLEMQAFLGLMAQDRSRLLLSVRIGPCTVPPFLNALLWIDALAMPFEEAIAKITSALAVETSTATQAPQTPSHRPGSSLPAPSSPPRIPDETPGRSTKPGDIFQMISLDSMQHLSEGYMAWYVDRVTRQLDETMAMLRAELRENDAQEVKFRPSPYELNALERLQRSGVISVDMLDRMVEQGEDWLTLTMRRLDYFERTGQAPKDYSTWCEHALSGAFDWIDPERGGDAGPAPRPAAQRSNAPDWQGNRQQQQQQQPDGNDDKGRNIFRIFSN